MTIFNPKGMVLCSLLYSNLLWAPQISKNKGKGKRNCNNITLYSKSYDIIFRHALEDVHIYGKDRHTMHAQECHIFIKTAIINPKTWKSKTPKHAKTDPENVYPDNRLEVKK